MVSDEADANLHLSDPSLSSRSAFHVSLPTVCHLSISFSIKVFVKDLNMGFAWSEH